MAFATSSVTAHASSVTNGGTAGTVTFTGGDVDPPDNLGVTTEDFGGITYFVFADPGNTVNGSGSDPDLTLRCDHVPLGPPPGVDMNRARCPANGVTVLEISLEQGSDRLTIGASASPPGPAPGTLGRLVAVGGEGRDSLKGGTGPEVLEGGPGDDAPFDNGDGLERVGIDGGGGADQLVGGTGDDVLQGGEGADRLDFAGRDDTLGRDMLDGGSGNDQLYGGPAAEQQDADQLSGGDGVDTADYSDRTSSLTVDLDGGGDDGQTGEHDNVEPDVERLIAGSDDDTLLGAEADNFVDGRAGDDRISGRGGNDVLDGGVNSPGSDSLVGGAGRDTLNGRAGDDELGGGDENDSLAGAGGTDTLDGDEGNDGLEGGAGSDTVNGGDGDDIVNGAAADLVGADGGDHLKGGLGADLLLGADGDDDLDGGLGSDVMNGGDGTDTVDYGRRSGRVTVTLDGVPNDGEPLEGDNVLPSVENVNGGTDRDDITGDRRANMVDAGPGEDLVNGKGGRDELAGGNAPDLMWSRDGERDQVNCGDDGDIAITDGQDVVRDCKWEDPGGRRRLAVAQSGLVTGSAFRYRLPDGDRYYGLEDPLKFPIGSTIDARVGAVRVATAKNSKGARQEIRVLGGPFKVRQGDGRRPTTELRLVGSARGCTRSANGPKAPTDARVPRLDAQTEKRKSGKYRVRGKHSVGAPSGTSWVTEERCDGTFTRVRSGTVRVRDLERNRTITLHAGETYLARPR
jgi:Ca2+-binding RTX toxin-like protein